MGGVTIGKPHGDRPKMISRNLCQFDANVTDPKVSERWPLPAELECGLKHRLFRAELEVRQARYRQWKFDQILQHHVNLLGETIPTRSMVSQGPAGTAAAVIAHLDFCQLVCDGVGRHHLFLKGWAWSTASTVIALDLFLDNSRWLQFDYGDPRKDVREHFSGPEAMEPCGFSECLALPESFQPTTKCRLQISDLNGHWTSFEIQSESNYDPNAARRRTRPTLRQRWRDFTRQGRCGGVCGDVLGQCRARQHSQ